MTEGERRVQRLSLENQLADRASGCRRLLPGTSHTGRTAFSEVGGGTHSFHLGAGAPLNHQESVDLPDPGEPKEGRDEHASTPSFPGRATIQGDHVGRRPTDGKSVFAGVLVHIHGSMVGGGSAT